MVVQMMDGSEFSALVHVESGLLHVAGHAGGIFPFTLVIKPGSALQICRRILQLLGDDQLEQVQRLHDAEIKRLALAAGIDPQSAGSITIENLVATIEKLRSQTG
jgi:hypothetical protein